MSRDCGRSPGGGGGGGGDDSSVAEWSTVAADAGRDGGGRGGSTLSDSLRASRRTDKADFSSSELERRGSAGAAAGEKAAGASAMPASISTALVCG